MTRLVRIRGAAESSALRLRYEGHVAEVLSGDVQGSGRLDVRVRSLDATLALDAANADHICHAPAPGAPCMRPKCVSAFCARRLLSAVLNHGELVEYVISFLQLPAVDNAKVVATAASSTARGGACSPAFTLDVMTDNWWISKPGSCSPDGRGCEWVQYELGPEPRRVHFLRIKIPKLPYGPLSVRVFHLEASDAADGPFLRASPDLTTFDTERLQDFALMPPVDARFVRLVCTVNAAASDLEDKWNRLSGIRLVDADCVGFYHVAFA